MRMEGGRPRVCVTMVLLVCAWVSGERVAESNETS